MFHVSTRKSRSDSRIPACLFLLTLGITTASSAANRENQDAIIDLLRLSGMNRQLEGVEARMLDHIESRQGQVAQPIRDLIGRIVQTEFDSELLEKGVLERIRADAIPARVETALDWLRSPVGRRITEAETAASGTSAARKMEAYTKALERDPPSPERLDLMQKLDKASGATETAVDVAIAMSLGVAVAFEAVGGSATDLQGLETEVQAQRAVLRPVLGEVVLASLLFSYQALPDDDLEAYLEFLESSTGEWYSRAISRALYGVLAEAGLRFGSSLRRELAVLAAGGTTGINPERVRHLFRSGRYIELVELTSALGEGDGVDAAALEPVMLRAISLRRLGRTEDAIRNFESATDIVRGFDNVHAEQFGELFYELAELYGEQGDIERAIEVVDEGLRLRPQSSTHQILAAYWHETLGRTKTARARYREVLPTLAPDSEGRVVTEARLAVLEGGAAQRARAEQASQDVYLNPVIALVPVNGVDERVDLFDACLLLEAQLELRCSVSRPIRISEDALLDGDRLQYNAERILAALAKARQPDQPDVFVLGVTDRDIYRGDASFLFSLQNAERGVAVVSSYRLLERLPAYWDPKVLATRRLLIQMLSAVGNGFALERPRSAHCPLAYPNGVEAFLTKGTHLCESTETQWRQKLKAMGKRRVSFDEQRLASLLRLQRRYMIGVGQTFEYNVN